MQNKSPAFQFYPKQWLGDNKVRLMDRDVRSMHHDLMCYSWQEDEPGTLPKDEKKLQNLLEFSKKNDWKKRVFPQLLTSWKVWEEDETRLVQNGLRREYVKQKLYSERTRKGVKTKLERSANTPAKDLHNYVMELEDEDEVEVKEVKDLKTKNELIQNSADVGIPISGASPDKKLKARDPVEDFLIFAQKTHERERKALLMIRGIVDREKVKSLFDGGIDPKTLSFAWLEFLADEGDYFQQSDAPPHNIAVFHGQVETGRYLETAARRIVSTKAQARPQPPPRVLTKPREPLDPELAGLWDKCLEKIKAQVSPEAFTSWFEPTYPKNLENGSLTVAVPNQISRKCLIENYRDLIEKTLQGIRDGPLLVDFCIESELVGMDTG